jgi:hypothetical protein
LAFIALFASVGCSAQRTATELVGLWEPDEASERAFGIPGQPRITLNSDRTFTASGIQSGLLYNPEALNGSGTWKRIGNEVFLMFIKINDKDEVFEARIGILEQPKLRLFFYRGGRTDGYRFFFEKQ